MTSLTDEHLRASWDGNLLSLRHQVADLMLTLKARRLREALRLEERFNPDQPRVPAGNADGGQWTGGGGTDAFAGGEGNDRLEPARNYSVNLAEEDARGGHAVRDHVGKKDSELVEIVRNNVYRGPVADLYGASFSSYESLDAANDFTNQILREYEAVVDQVALGTVDDAWLPRRFGYPTGREAFRAGANREIVVRLTYNAGVYVVHDARTRRGYRVHTSYPFNEFPQ